MHQHVGELPPPPAGYIQIEALNDVGVNQAVVVEPNFWAYYGPWATAFATYYQWGIMPLSYIDMSRVVRAVWTPDQWQEWIWGMGPPDNSASAVRKPVSPGAIANAASSGPPLPPPPPATTITMPASQPMTVSAALGAMWQDVLGAWGWLKTKISGG